MYRVRYQVAVNAVFVLHVEDFGVCRHYHETCSCFVSENTLATRYLQHSLLLKGVAFANIRVDIGHWSKTVCQTDITSQQ